ncbi:MAG: DUF389 domain-containing protein [Anaerolineae bacterium]|nr:DUF389 domain-containing protein [Anaerolineae bacterium]
MSRGEGRDSRREPLEARLQGRLKGVVGAVAPATADRPYHVVVAVGSERQLRPLMSFGCAVALARRGRVTLVTVTPDGEHPAWLQIPSFCQGVPVDVVVVRQMQAPGRDIVHMVNQELPDLLVIGWRGRPTRGRHLLGRTLDPVLQDVLCDVAVARADVAEGYRSILVPTAGGPNAARAIEVALSLGADVQVTALYVARRSLGQPEVALGRERLREALSPWAGDVRLRSRVVQAYSVVRGILGEANSGRYDLLLIGATNEGTLDRVLFGNVPLTVAVESPIPAVVIKHQAVSVHHYLRHAWWRVLRVFPTISTAEQADAYRRIHRGARPDVDFFVMIGLSAALAAVGLLMNSPAVIIGAMLVAPLMSAILALGLGVTMGNLRMIRMAAEATLKGMVLAILVGVLIGLVVPGASRTGEMLARASPSVLDLIVALISGMAGAYAVCRSDVSAALVGVAISAAVVPPLATVGLAMSMLDVTMASGALLLFLTNLVAISAGGGLMFLVFGFQPEPGEAQRSYVFRSGLAGIVILLAAVAVPLAWLTLRSAQEAALRRAVMEALQVEAARDSVEVVEWHMRKGPDDTLQLWAVIRSDHEIGSDELLVLQQRLGARLKHPVRLHLGVIPVHYLEVVVPTSTPAVRPLP